MKLTLTNSEFEDIKNALHLYIETSNGNFNIILENINESASDELSEYNMRDIQQLLDNIHKQEFENIKRKIFGDEYEDDKLVDVKTLYNKLKIINDAADNIIISINDNEYSAIKEAIRNQKLIAENNVEEYLDNVFNLNEESKIFSSVLSRILNNYKEYRNYSNIKKYDNLLKKLQ